MPQMLVALDYSLSTPRQIVITGKRDAPETGRFLPKVHRQFLPNTVVLLADGGDRAKISRRKTGSSYRHGAAEGKGDGVCLRELRVSDAGYKH